MKPITNSTVNAASAAWATYPWPAWIPHSVRAQVEDIWPIPTGWDRDRVLVRAPIVGAAIHLPVDERMVSGLYVHLRGLAGRVIVPTDPVRVYCTTLVAGTPRGVSHR